MISGDALTKKQDLEAGGYSRWGNRLAKGVKGEPGMWGELVEQKTGGLRTGFQAQRHPRKGSWRRCLTPSLTLLSK